MEVQVISNTVQKFNGESFYLCGPYFQHKGKRLHRTVWEYHNGEIPKGYDIHHIDHNKSNNSIENLAMLKKEEHYRNHMKEPERIEASKRAINIAREAAAKWHGSEDGFEFHSKLAKQYWSNAPLRTYKCTFCGKEFQTKYVYGPSQNHFCHQNCKAKYRRWRLELEGQMCG